MTSPDAISEALPALQNDAVPVLERVAPQGVRRDISTLRQRLIEVVNAAMAGDAAHAHPHDAMNDLREGMALGIGYISAKRGDARVREYLAPSKLHEVVAIGRKLKRLFLDRMNALEERNALPGGERLSAIIGHVMEREDPLDPPIVSPDFKWAAEGRIDSIPDLHRYTEDMERLERILDLADFLGINARAIAAAKGNDIESGLVHLMSEADQRIGYLETGVFCAVFAHRRGIRGTTQLTFPSSEAVRFLREFDSNGTYRAKPLEEYAASCEAVFGDRSPEAEMVLRHYLDQVRQMVNLYRWNSEPPNAETVFPVHRFSARALTLRRRQMNRDL